MYNIQIIQKSKNNREFENIVFSTIDSPKSPEDFVLNILNLGEEQLWRGSSGGNGIVLNDIKDIKTLGKMVEHSQSLFIVKIPNNIEILYDYKSERYGYSGYSKSCKLKDNLSPLIDVLQDLCLNVYCDFRFEPTETLINGKIAKSDFCFTNMHYDILTKSNISNRVTTIKKDNIILTTLDLGENVSYEDFISELNLFNNKSDAPVWFNDFIFFDDKTQMELIEKEQQKIAESHSKIDKSKKKLDVNNHYKSIIYSNSDELVQVCCEIIDEMLGIETLYFQDEHKEDFSTVLGECTIIGEIKGVAHGVKNSMISQLENHRDEYIERNVDIEENKIRSLLIINHNRNIPLEEREDINKKQIEKAKNKNILIIETITLLKLYEKYINKEIDREKIIDLFVNNEGLLLL